MRTSDAYGGTWLAQFDVMNRQAKGAAIALVFVAAFITSIAFQSVVASVTVLLSAVTVAFIVGIAWMRTAPNRVRGKQPSENV
jgi:hypothetical protein